MMSVTARLDAISNVATIALAAILSAVLVKVYLVPTATPRQPAAAHAEAVMGTKLTLPGVDWHANGRTLVLALSSQCHFCKESSPFYRRFQQEVGNRFRTVALFPQPVAEAEHYLTAEGVHFDFVKQFAPAAVGVRGTPTLLLVDAEGIVTRVWVGKLNEEEEEAVLSLLKKG
jgi:hypothetical protein